MSISLIFGRSYKQSRASPAYQTEPPIRFELPTFLCMAQKAAIVSRCIFPSPSHPSHRKNMASPRDYSGSLSSQHKGARAFLES